MKAGSFAIALLSVLWGTSALGTVENRQFFSDALGEMRWVQVYLPDDYDPDAQGGYPVVYWLHGVNSNHLGDDYLVDALNILIATGQIQPMIAVKPDGSGCPWGPYNGCGWTNSELVGDFEDYVVNDLVNWVELEYNASLLPNRRAIMGLSMGAFGAMHAALRNPDRFRAVAAHSGYLFFDDFPIQHRPRILAEWPAGPPYNWAPIGMFTAGWFLFSGGFSPNLANPPHYIDFPLDEFGTLRAAVWDRWLLHDPARLAATLTPATAPAIYFDCGTSDEFYFHPFNLHFHERLTALGLAHEWQSFNGSHVSHIDQRVLISLRFLDDAMSDPTGVEDTSSSSASPLLYSNVPNPTTGRTTIRFRLVHSGEVSLAIFDIAGRLCERILDSTLSEGEHRLEWDASGLPAGVYLCRLSDAAGEHAQKFVIRR